MATPGQQQVADAARSYRDAAALVRLTDVARAAQLYALAAELAPENLQGLDDALNTALASGNLAGANDFAQRLVFNTQRLAEADPTHAERVADHAVSHHKVGGVQLQMGDAEAGLALLRAGRGMIAPLAEASGHALYQSYLEAFDSVLNNLPEGL